jgi:hypothetical protein
MTKRILILILAGMLLLSGCITKSPGTTVLVVTATPSVVQEQQVVYITATPNTAATNAVATAAGTSLKITNIVDNGGGLATIYWESVGDFPVGFELVWSDSNQSPSFPTDPSMYIGDPNKRSAQIQGDATKTYYVRICRYVNNSCDVYSNTGTISFTKPTATAAVPTATSALLPPPPIYYPPTATPYSGPPFIKISSITYAGSATATVTWQAYGSFPEGFLILYVKGTAVPTYGDYQYYSVPSGSKRSFTVYGTNDSTYTFVVCRWTGTTCDMNSPAVRYTFIQKSPTKTPGGIYPVP